MRTPDGLREAMQRINGRRGYTSEKWPEAPFLMTHDGREWALATDGHLLLAVRRELVAGECTPVPEKVAALAAKWLDRSFEASTAVAGAAVKAFAGVPTFGECDECQNKRVIECEDCDGEGGSDCECSTCGDTHDRSCKTCDGSGSRTCPECGGVPTNSPAVFLGQKIDRWKLAVVLDSVGVDDDEQIHVCSQPISTATKFSGYVLWPSGDLRWRALVMGMVETVPTKVDFEKPETWTRAPVDLRGDQGVRNKQGDGTRDSKS